MGDLAVGKEVRAKRWNRKVLSGLGIVAHRLHGLASQAGAQTRTWLGLGAAKRRVETPLHVDRVPCSVQPRQELLLQAMPWCMRILRTIHPNHVFSSWESGGRCRCTLLSASEAGVVSTLHPQTTLGNEASPPATASRGRGGKGRARVTV